MGHQNTGDGIAWGDHRTCNADTGGFETHIFHQIYAGKVFTDTR